MLREQDAYTDGTFRFFPSTPVLVSRHKHPDRHGDVHISPSPTLPGKALDKVRAETEDSGKTGGIHNKAFEEDVFTTSRELTNGLTSHSDETTSTSKCSFESSLDTDGTSSSGSGRSSEGGWGWMVTGGSFLVLFVIFGMLQSFGILYMRLLSHFRASRAQTAWIGSLASGLFLLLGPIAGWLSDKLGYRIVTILGACVTTAGYVMSAFTPNMYFLYFSYGVVCGCGFGLMMLPAGVIVTVYFERRRSLAVSLAGIGAGVGTLAIPPFTQLLLDHYGLTGAMLILGGVSLQAAVGGALFRQPPRVTSPDEAAIAIEDTILGKPNPANAGRCGIFRNVRFTVYVIATFFTMIGYFVPFVHLPDRATDLGEPGTRAALLISVLGGASMAGRVVFGWVADFRCTQRAVLVGVSSMLCGGATLLLPALTQYWMLLLYAVFHGCFIGVWVSLQTVVMSDVAGVAALNSAVGIMSFFHGLGAFVSSPIAGFLYDRTSDYMASFYVAGALFLGSGLVVCFLPCGGLPDNMVTFSVYVSRLVSLPSSRRASLDVSVSHVTDVTTKSSRRASFDVISSRKPRRPQEDRRASVAVVSHRGLFPSRQTSCDSGISLTSETSLPSPRRTSDLLSDPGWFSPQPDAADKEKAETTGRQGKSRPGKKQNGLHISLSASHLPTHYEGVMGAAENGNRRASAGECPGGSARVMCQVYEEDDMHVPENPASESTCVTYL